MQEPPEGDDVLTERDRAVARAIAEIVTQTIIARILTAAKDEKVTDEIVGSWGARIDRVIGRALRRFGFFVFITLIGVGAAKLGLWDKFWSLLK